MSRFFDDYGDPVRWADATGWQRVGLCGWRCIEAVLVFAMFIAAMAVLGTMVDVAAQKSVIHDQCLKHATNGYEIKQCR